MKFLEDLPLEERLKYVEAQKQKAAKNKALLAHINQNTGNYKYRCEQTVANKINGAIRSHAETKREFELNLSIENGQPIAKTKMLQSHINIYPAQLSEVMELVSDIDYVKSDASLLLDKKTGKIIDVLNLDTIKENWSILKTNIKKKYNYANDAKAQENAEHFLKLAEEPMLSRQNLVNDLNSKIFFDVFFDKYLVLDTIESENYTQTFCSYLFDQQTFEVSIKQDKISNQEFKRAAQQCHAEWKLNTVETLYNSKYKAMIGYNFSDYDFSFNQTFMLSEKGIPEKINTQIIEQVRNNIEIYIGYKLYRI